MFTVEPRILKEYVFRFQEQGVHTATSVEQRNVEELCLR
jgi:hypothetical protein